MRWKAFLKKRGPFVVIVLGIAAVVLVLGGESCAKSRVVSTFYRYQEIYAQAAEPILSSEPTPEVELPGIQQLFRHRSEKDGTVWIADFFVDGWGIAPSSVYRGFYATTDGEPAGFQGTDITLTEDGKGWSWQQPGGDNAYYTEEIADGWYYYRAVF